LTPEHREALSKIMLVGYVGGVVPAADDGGVTVHDKGRAYEGLNLFTSGHGAEAMLMDMDGEVLYTWRYDFSRAWPDVKLPRDKTSDGSIFWRRVNLSDNGDLWAIFEGLGLMKVDRDSNLVWARRGGFHHDLFVTDNGYLYVLKREEKIIPRINRRRAVFEDFIVIMTPDGEVERSVSVLEAFENSPYAPVLDKLGRSGDILHTYTVEVLDGRLGHLSPAFRQGNVLISLRALDTIAVLDMEQEAIAWALTGRWRKQHQPVVLRNGHMLLFNNIARDGVSEVIEFDPFTQEVFWFYRGGLENSFYTLDCGSCERLPNGNTLITESNCGRAFEVTPHNIIVWEYVNTYRAGKNRELIATIPEMLRLPPDFPLNWREE